MTILLWIKSLFLKVINFLFGKTHIFITILGWFLIASGAIMSLSPEKARNKLVGIGFGQIKGIILVIAVFLASLLLSLGNKIGNIFALLGIAGVIFLYFILKKKAHEKIKVHFAKIPVKFLRVFACVQIVIGALMLILSKRIL